MKKGTKTLLLLFFTHYFISAQSQKLNAVPLGSYTVVDQSVFEDTYRQPESFSKKIDRDGVSERVMREFRFHFLEATNMEWFSLDRKNKRYVVYFWYEGKKGKALYTKSAGLQYAILYAPETVLSENDRKALDFYPGYTISNVIETTAEGQTFLVVKLKKQDHVVLTKLKYGIVTELQDWKEPNITYDMPNDKKQVVTQKSTN